MPEFSLRFDPPEGVDDEEGTPPWGVPSAGANWMPLPDDPPSARAATATAMAPFPRPGAAVAGFRLVLELGRGAFARVYLAEQADLAGRLVALKVTRDEGPDDEAQILARLQHAHIVPIHSVHADPATGLRLLCMPYLGGANLAEVLEAAGARRPEPQATGRSLVEALDEVGRAASTPGPPSLNRPRSARSVGPAAVARGRDATVVAGPAIGRTPSAVRSVLGRYLGAMVGRRIDPGADPAGADAAAGVERGQPARLFLRGASYIQAAVWIAARLAEALEHAHARGLLHRDLKPSNILIAADGTPMLLDFNLSAEAAPAAEGEGAARAKLGGTLPYMAPEHLDAFNPRGSTPPGAVDQRADVYALGLILFEMAAGRHPFAEPPDGLPIVEVLKSMTAERRRGAPSARAINPEIPWSLDALLARCLDPDPARRYQAAGDLAEDLRRFLDDRPLRHAPEPSLRERAAKWLRRNPRATSASTVAALALVLIVGLGGVLALVSGGLEGAAARLRRRDFAAEFAACQLLLNTASGPESHLDPGIDRAERALGGYGLGRSAAGDWADHPLLSRLDPAERAAVREEAAELLMLVARARVARSADRPEPVRRAELEAAVARLDLAERVDPRPSSALYADRARYRAAMGDANGAEADRRRAAAIPSATARDLYLEGTKLLAAHRADEAEPRLARAVAIDPRRFWAWFALGLCHGDQRRWRDAAHDFSVCTVIEPDFAWAQLNRGLALAKDGRLAEARAAYDRALAISPDFAEARVDRGLACLELGDPVAAVADLGRALALGRRELGTMVAWADALSRLGRRAEADREFAALLARRPNDPDPRVARGFTHLVDDPAAAVADFRRALALAPHHARAPLGLAFASRAADPRGALGQADRALAADPKLGEALQLRAVLRARLGDPAAIDDAAALESIPTPHRLYNAACALAILAQTTGEPRHDDDAIRLLRRAVATGFPPATAAADADFERLRDRDEFRAIVGR